MRLSNKRKTGIYNFISTAVVFFSILSIVVYIIDISVVSLLGWKALALMALSFLMLIIFYLKGRQIFEYDSDGEALNFKNRNVLSFLSKDISDEFPKYKLLKYDVVNALIFKRLYISISSKKGKSITLRYDISYLTNKEIRDLKISLNKVIKENKERNLK